MVSRSYRESRPSLALQAGELSVSFLRGCFLKNNRLTPSHRPCPDSAMTSLLINVGHSPDPDDAFMFYALAHDKLDTGGLRFRHQLQDIETLNRRALRGELEVTAVS